MNNEFAEPVTVTQPKRNTWIALVLFNLVALTFDARALDVVWRMTQSPVWIVVTLFATGLAFVMHEILWHNAHASKTQKQISMGGIVVAVLGMIVVGTMDAIKAGGGAVSATALLVTIGALTAIHFVLWAAYYYSDEAKQAQEKTARVVARMTREAELLREAEALLRVKQTYLAREEEIAAQYGAERLRALTAELSGREYVAPPAQPEPAPADLFGANPPKPRR